MKILKHVFINERPFSIYLLSLLIVVILQSCKNDTKTTPTPTEAPEKEVFVDILTENMEFQMPDTITSGWNTFRYKNASPQTHFFLVDKYPEGKTAEDAETYVAPVFDSAMKLIMEGKTEEGFAEFAKLPEWFKEVYFVGGSGLLSPNQTAVTTLNLKPGKYMLECYVKMSNGMFHTSMGMTKDLIVSDLDSGNEAPTADIDITLSSTKGIVVPDSIAAGTHTFSVFFEDQILHEHFVGHDINLVRLDDNADMAVLEMWMNWADPKGLIEPAPPGMTFLGGVNDMPAGNTGYFTATLHSGRYAFIAEVPNASKKNMLKVFMVQ